MEQLITSLAQLLEPFRHCFRHEAFHNFRAVTDAWIVCLGPRTLSEVWQVCSLQSRRHYSCIYDLFSRAHWQWDDLGRILLLLLVARFVPEGLITLVVDDTLCHKRGQRVTFAGIYLDPVLSSKSRKVLRYALNYVVLAIVVYPPFRPDHPVALPVFWRVFRKKGTDGHRKKTALARELVQLVAALLPDRHLVLVADGAYTNKELLQNRPDRLTVVGPLQMRAALYRRPGPRQQGQKGRRRKKGERLPTPRAILDAPEGSGVCADEVTLTVYGKPRRARLQVMRGVLWYAACRESPVMVVLLHDPQGKWRDEVLMCTDVAMAAEQVVAYYCRRWSIEVTFRIAKQHTGMQDPQVRCGPSVERAHPMGLFLVSVVVWWNAEHGVGLPPVRRVRPWYVRQKAQTFSSLLGKLRLAIWTQRISEQRGSPGDAQSTLEKLLHELAAVR